MPGKRSAKKSASRTTAHGKASTRFTDEERAAMRERAREMKAEQAAPGAVSGGDESAVLAKIAGMPSADRTIGERIHAIVKNNAPELSPKLWYGMPAYARDGKIVCFFQGAHKFKARYATLGFTDKANLDEGRMWPAAFALTELTAAEEVRIGALVKKAVG